MANDLVDPNKLAAPVRGLAQLPWLRQLAVLVGLAASVALGAAAVLWMQTPGYRLLYTGLAEKDQARIVDELQKVGIPYQLDTASGTIYVPEARVHDARLKLAAQGLPRSSTGFEMFGEGGSAFGTSQLIENARYQHALEGELARSIETIQSVERARVHLALPRQSGFLRDRQQPSASVVVNLYPGRHLDPGQVMAIVNLVASSIPNLSAERVTVVDQSGRLLNAPEKSHDLAISATQFEYTRRLEEAYVKRIEDILAPIIGPNGVRSQVALDLDFTVTEQTQERYDPQGTVVRSEQVAEERSSGPGAGAIGVPGALSNQPPGAGSAPETTPKAAAPAARPGAAATGAAQAAAAAEAENLSRRATRNYELDRTISHTRIAPGRIRRLTVAVVVDDKPVVNEDGEIERKPLSEAELARITALVKEAVGFNAERGDSVQVTNIAFTRPPEPEPPPEPSWFQRMAWLSVGKQLLGGLAVLALIFGVLRPLMKALAARAAPAPAEVAVPGLPAPPGSAAVALPAGAARGLDYEQQVAAARQLAAQDPKRVARVVKNWVAGDA
jgi:flagellar M-ring protein FliF